MQKSEASLEEVHAVISRCLNAFTGIEISLSGLFLTLNGANREWSEPHQLHPLTAAFDSVQSFEVRLGMVNNFVNSDPRLTDKFKDAWNTLRNNLERQKDRRNEIGHFAIVHTLVSMGNGKHASRYMVQPYFAVSKVLRGIARKPIKFNDLCAREAAFKKTKERLVSLSTYLRVIRDGALVAGQPVTDPDRLLRP